MKCPTCRGVLTTVRGMGRVYSVCKRCASAGAIPASPSYGPLAEDAMKTEKPTEQHLFLVQSEEERTRRLEEADVTSPHDMMNGVAHAAVNELVDHWSKQIGHGFQGSPAELLSDIKEARAHITDALDRLAAYVEANPVPKDAKPTFVVGGGKT